MKTLSSIVVVSAALLTSGASLALAQGSAAEGSYQVSELRLSQVPVPIQRPTMASADDRDLQDPKIEAVRRTAGGMRIVGPTFFPKD